MLNYSKFACNDYNYASVMIQDLDEYLIENNIDLYSLEPDEIKAVASIISGLNECSYSFNTTYAAICLANNYSYVFNLISNDLINSNLYLENPELCDCFVRYYVLLDIINERFDEHSRL